MKKLYSFTLRSFSPQLIRLGLLAIVLACVPLGAAAQTTDVGPPKSWTKTVVKPAPFLPMPDFDLAQVRAEDVINDANKQGAWRFGYEHQVNLDLQSAAQVQELPGQGRLYRLGLTSAGAISLNLVFTSYQVPEGATLHLYSDDRQALVGAYTARNNHPSGMLGTDLVAGDRIVVEYFEPYDAAFAGQLRIGTVVHGYRSPGIQAQGLLKALNDSGDCNVDVDCPAGDGWGNQIRSVGLLFTGGGVCSGALINNTENNGAPYFLTALHCGLNTGAWVVRFNWESTNPVCATTDDSTDPGPPYDETLNGATALATNSGSDFTLARLDNLTLQLMQDWNLYLSGWDRSDVAPTASTGIHHPRGDVKKICRDLDPATKNTITFNDDNNAMMWRVADWDVGVTEPGSSGSPLFDQNQRIIGQLCCGAAACNGTDDNNDYDHYGRFGVSWDGSSSADRLKDWLHPGAGAAPTLIDGLDPKTLLPDNDLCSNAISLSCAETVTGNALNATDEGAPANCDVATEAGVWFTFTGTGEVTQIETAGSAFDTRISVYTGTCGNLSCVGGDEDSGSGNSAAFEFCSEPGATYYIYLSGQPATTSEYTLSISCAPDTEKPTIANCPANIVEPYDPATCTEITTPAPTIDDNCGVTALTWELSGATLGGSTATGVNYVRTQQFNFGTTTVTYTVKDADGNTNTDCSFTVTVAKAQPTVTLSVIPNPQQYSDLATFTATLTGGVSAAGCDPQWQAAESAIFYVGSQQIGSADFSVSGTDLIASVSTCLLEQLAGTMAPGDQQVTAVFAGIDATHFDLSNSATTTLMIEPEDATVIYTGPEYFSTSGPNNCAGTITLMAYAEDDIDPAEGCRGNIRKAEVAFFDQALLLGSAAVGSISPSNIREGIAVTDYDYTLQNSECSGGGKTFEVTAKAGAYYTGQTDQTTLVTLALPSSNSVSGGGHLLLSQSAGSYAGTSGSKMNFGFTMRLNPGGKKLQGQINVIFRRLVAGEWRTYQIKSNKINSLAVDVSDPSYHKAIISTKATLRDITDSENPIDLGGNLSLLLEAWEHTTEATGKSDQLAVTLLRNSDLLFASSWNVTSPITQLLNGGKINVRQSKADKLPEQSPEQLAVEKILGAATGGSASLSTQPNPFRDQTLIQLETVKTQAVILRIYDARGRAVRTLYDGLLPAGPYQFTFDAANLPAGVYTCVLSTPAEVKTHRIVLVR